MHWYFYLIYSVAGILAFILLAILLAVIYIKLTTRKCKSNVRLVGRTTIVTGANTGIGYETALDFAARGAKVILACRGQQKGTEAVEKIIKATNNANVFFKPLDLSSFKSVRKFAEEINNSEERLDILVNNAGALALPSETTEDGLMLLMQTNYFGPFLLTILLLNLMTDTPYSRIVNVSSKGADYVSKLDINNLNDFSDGRKFKDSILYARSKICNILFTIKLAEKLRNTSVTTYSLHPGTVATEIFRNQGCLFSSISKIMSFLFFKTSKQGAATNIYCSVTEGIENLSGEHFDNCHVVKRYKLARDPELIDKLWNVTEKLLKLDSQES